MSSRNRLGFERTFLCTIPFFRTISSFSIPIIVQQNLFCLTLYVNPRLQLCSTGRCCANIWTSKPTFADFSTNSQYLTLCLKGYKFITYNILVHLWDAFIRYILINRYIIFSTKSFYIKRNGSNESAHDGWGVKGKEYGTHPQTTSVPKELSIKGAIN